MEIRRGVDGDAAGVALVHVRSWQAAYRGLLSQDFLDGLDVEKRSATWQQWLARVDWPGTGVFVAEENFTIVGFAGFSPSRDDDAGPRTAQLATFYLLEDVWGRGIGRALLASVIDSWRRADFLEATLWVLESNHRARGFYEHFGWRADGAAKRDDALGLALDEIRYRLQIG